MKFVFVGGHLAPALAVLDALPKDCDVYFFGRKYTFEADKTLSLEYSTMQAAGIKFYALTSGRLQRVLTAYTLFSFIKIPYGMLQAFRLLVKIKPDAVIAFGGYLAIPVCFSAFFLRIPIIIHEQTLGAGLANRLIAPIASRICIAWESSKAFFPASKTVLTGNPVRKEILNPPPKFSIFNFQFSIKDKNLPIIFITGGSAGSHFINIKVEDCIKQLLEKFIIVHQTGDAKEFADYERLNTLRESLPPRLKTRYIIRKFIDPSEIGVVMEASSLIISRSGINTVTEIMHAGKPCVLIPLTHGQRGEQAKNAHFLQSIGLASVVAEDSLTIKILLTKINDMMGSLDKYINQAKQAKKMLKLDAAYWIVRELYAVAKKST